MVATLLVLGLTGVAAATDLAWHKIYNWTTYPGILAGVSLNALGQAAIVWPGVEEAWLARLGWIGAGASLLGLAVCGFLMVACFVLFRVGGGDVKLMAMLGALTGPQRGLEILLWTFVLGACAAVVVLIWRVGAWRVARRAVVQVLYTLRLGSWAPLTPDERARLQPPVYLAPAALAAVLIVEFSLADLLALPFLTG